MVNNLSVWLSIQLRSQAHELASARVSPKQNWNNHTLTDLVRALSRKEMRQTSLLTVSVDYRLFVMTKTSRSKLAHWNHQNKTP